MVTVEEQMVDWEMKVVGLEVADLAECTVELVVVQEEVGVDTRAEVAMVVEAVGPVAKDFR